MSDELVAMIREEAEESMAAAVTRARSDFSSVRTGRATPALVEKIQVDYYGAMVPLQQLAGFAVPEARTLVVQPFDKSSVSAIERALQQSDLGINPNNDGTVIRLIFPPLTEERRKSLVKVVKQMAEDGRVGIRSHRRAARHDLEALEKSGDISEDELQREKERLDKMTHKHEAAIDQALEQKEQELLEV